MAAKKKQKPNDNQEKLDEIQGKWATKTFELGKIALRMKILQDQEKALIAECFDLDQQALELK